jgi:hypothetical protein
MCTETFLIGEICLGTSTAKLGKNWTINGCKEMGWGFSISKGSRTREHMVYTDPFNWNRGCKACTDGKQVLVWAILTQMPRCGLRRCIAFCKNSFYK